ncbi:MAG: S9 family peptidase [Aureispira sp.]
MSASWQLSAQLKDITIPDIWETYRFYPEYVPGFNFMKDGKHYSVLQGNQILQYDLASGDQTAVIYTPVGLALSSYSFSENENQIVLETDREQIYRRSSRANFYIWNREKETLTTVSKTGKQRYATLDAAGERVAFVRGNNLFYKHLGTDKEVQVTTDGAVNAIINGATDWVYEEEFAISKAFEWSPKGNKIAFLRFDESKVKEFTYTSYTNELYPIYNTFKYPKAGEDNAIVTVHIYDLESKKITDVKIKKTDQEQYIPRIKWVNEEQLCITKLNRHQNNLTLLLANPKNGSTKVLLEEKNEYFIDVHDNLTFLEDESFIWTSDADGYNHLYLYNKKGKLIRQLTKGAYDVIQFYGLDTKNKQLYFKAAKSSAKHRGLYSVPLKGGEPKALHPNEGVNSAQFSSTFEYFVNTYSKATQPPTYKVYATKDLTLVRTIEENKMLQERLVEYNMGEHSFFDFVNADSVVLHGWMIKPPNFDPNKKYPVFMYTYGGPGNQTVMDRWGGQNYLWFQMLAQKGYIIVSVDNRGTDARGEAFRKSTYMNLGGLETQDQIEAARYFAQQPYVDKERIGIFGWSFGGYLSTSCLAKGNDVFKMAIAVAPVINWKWYDTIYTERFMRTPKENNKGYEDNSPINFAGDIKGKYLLVHGMSDDNVHFQNAAEMARALIAKNIPFDEAYYPNKNHGIYGGATRSHLYHKMTNFVLENL